MQIGLIVAQIIGILFSFSVIYMLVHDETSSGNNLLMCMMFLSMIQGGAYLLELLAQTQGEALLAIRMEYLGSGFLVIMISRFMYIYCNIKEPRKLFYLLEVIAIICVVGVWTNDMHHLFYKSVTFETEPSNHLVLEHGFLFYLFVVACTLIPYIIAEFSMIYSMIVEDARNKRSQYSLILVISCLPISTIILYTTDFMGDYDPIPPMMSIMLAGVVLFVWRRHQYDLTKAGATTVLEELSDSVIMLDEDKRIVSFNTAASEAFADLSEQSFGRNIMAVRDFPLELFEDEQKHKLEINGRFYEGRSKKITDSQKGVLGYITIMYDSTDNKKGFDRMIEMRKKAEKSMNVMTGFMNTMSHEIAHPIELIMGLSDLIMEECRGRKVYQFACDIKDATNTLQEVTDNMVKLTKIENGKVELNEQGYNLKSLLNEVSDVMDIVAKKKGIQFACEMDDALPCILNGDEKVIKEMLIDAVTASIRNTQEGYVKLSVSGEITGGFVKLIYQIEDSGIGFRQAEVRRVQNYFDQEIEDNRAGRSTAENDLSLAVAKRTIDLLGATVQIASVYGEGLTLTIAFEQQILDHMTIGQYTEVKTEDDAIRMFSAPKCKVLVVDDNLINRKVAIGMLETYKFQVDEAESGVEAIEKYKQKAYDFIFMDQMMPGMDGIEAMKRINDIARENSVQPIIIVLTANDRFGAREMLLNAGFQDYLSKPVERNSIHYCMMKWVPESEKIYRDEEFGESSMTEVLLDDLDSIFMNGINIAMAMKKHRGNLNDYLEILSLYYFDGLSKPKMFEKYYTEHDFENYRVLCHAIRGASENIGAQKLAEQLSQLEVAASRADEQTVANLHEEMLDSYVIILGEIQATLEKKNFFGEDHINPKNELTKDEIIARLHALYEQVLEETREPSLDAIKEIRKNKLSSEVDDLLCDARTNIMMNEFGEAKNLLEVVLTNIEGE